MTFENILLAWYFPSCLACAEKHQISRPNFIIFIADNAVLNDSEACGNPLIKTLRIDALAKQGNATHQHQKHWNVAS